MAAKPHATKPSRHATKHDGRDEEIARLKARVAELEQAMAASQGKRAGRISLSDAIIYVADR
jgi:hypothetical protein